MSTELQRKRWREYYYRNKIEREKYRKQYVIRNKERIKEVQKKYKEKNKERTKKVQLKYQQKNKGRFKILRKEYSKKNRKRINTYTKEYRSRYVWKKYHRKYLKIKSQQPQFRLSKNMSNGIRKSILRGKEGAHWESMVDYSLGDLRKHLEKQFTGRMNWNNYGPHWCIDHRIPRSYFKFKDCNDESFKACWALDNLQPKTIKDNMKKSNNYSEPTLNQMLTKT